MAEIAQHDMYITRLKNELAMKKKYLVTKREQLRKSAIQNQYLLPILREYDMLIHKHEDCVRRQKLALNDILKWLQHETLGLAAVGGHGAEGNDKDKRNNSEQSHILMIQDKIAELQ